jgi:ribosomal protein S18 acetylase RimI-like enzyme
VIRVFSEDDLGAAAALLAERHRRDREAEPLLPGDVDCRAEVDALWRQDAPMGAMADDAYVLGFSRDDSWGPNVWIEAAGHAADDPERLREVYTAAAADWFARGLKAHYAVVPAADGAFVDAWFRLGFGAQQALGIMEVPDVEWPAAVREARADDVDALVALAPLLQQHQWLSPVFSAHPLPTEEAYRESILEDTERDDVGNLVFELDGRVVANFVVAPVALASMHPALTRPADAAYLAFAITHPDARGSGAGVALTTACFAWARSKGRSTMVTDWRVTNLLASRFWPSRGFRTSFLRLHRLIA